MRVKALRGESNTGLLEPCSGVELKTTGNVTTGKRVEFDWIEIKKGRYIHQNCSHPLRSGDENYFKRIHGLEYKNRKIYWLYTFGSMDKPQGHHVGFSWWEHQKFLWLQEMHWLQKENNIRYMVNLIFLVLGVVIAFKQL
ncbi:hypothetical protein K6119_15790 [Paracrocinitomix mangrovi]|uniref:hypothetical protein n=1 Tax=Paracrocinitomix mangrovi TaxID=2862509 RepID=UPI001C8E0850|nr:hypothetical protein [Paracrocinitomix mangrovi]UKN01192.1 hypothetical protein K6119_15790 [Paracrocinitomix mangrovi]